MKNQIIEVFFLASGLQKKEELNITTRKKNFILFDSKAI